jgi:hypothetical protein
MFGKCFNEPLGWKIIDFDYASPENTEWEGQRGVPGGYVYTGKSHRKQDIEAMLYVFQQHYNV